MRFKLITILFLCGIAFSACVKKDEPKAADVAPGTHKVVVEEVLQVTQYTYMKVKEAGQEFWIAVPKIPVEKGATLYFTNGMEMKNFKSTDLNRTFESVLFVQDISTTPASAPGASPHGDAGAMSNQPQKPTIEKESISVAKAKGGVSISELYAGLAKFSAKTVKVSGKVTKVNNGIMGKNWVHIQDGTDYSGNFDLTVTTMASVEIGNTVVFEGKIALNKDFGYGYSYKVLLEDAVLSK